MERIEAVIFDWGGVLADNPAPQLMAYCAEALKVPVETYTTVHDKHSEPFQKGQIAETLFWQRVCGELDRPLPRVASLWGQALGTILTPREAVFRLAGRIRDRGVKIAVLSNAEAPAIQLSRHARYGIFDVVVLSCVVGMAKPEREIYETTAAKLGAHPQGCIFIDDKQAFVDGAAAVGMKGILYRNFEQVEQRLEDLGLPVRQGR
jgi:putative hydrolase of the HAD superfamily